MDVLFWIVFGLIVGWIASLAVNRRGEGFFLNVALGIAGALVGGALFRSLGTPVYFGFNFGAMIVSVIGAVIVLLLYHAVTGRRGLR